MFAFAIWDSARRLLFMARDHMGQKPLFFYHNGREFLFASEVKSLLASGRISTKPDLNALWHYMSLRFLPDRYSLFERIEKLPAGSWITWHDGTVEMRTYWSPAFCDQQSGNEEDIEEALNQLLLDTVKMHLLSDVRVGALLSGGIDSSLVASMMAQVSGERIPTFSIGVAEHDFNELPYARMVNARYGMEPHERVVRADLIRRIPSMIYHLDEPSDPFGVGVYLAAQLASDSVKVVLGGDGGDENFAGYDRFAGQRFVDYWCILPDWVRQRVMKKVIAMIPESFTYKSLAQKARWVNEMSFFTRGERYAHSLSFLRFSPQLKEELFTPWARRAISDDDSVEKILRYFNAGSADELVDRMLYTDLMTRMPDHLLPIVDRMSMAHSVECRAPLIDYKVVEYAASIPAHLKLKGRTLKYMLTKVAARYLPNELIHRRKQGFGFPLALWMRTELKDFIGRLFGESRFVGHGVFERSCIDRLCAEHFQGKADHNFRLWMLINLEIWYRLYFENASVNSMNEYIDGLVVQ
jgi:asparagine synthase (glutamine-hydrolysing)